MYSKDGNKSTKGDIETDRERESTCEKKFIVGVEGEKETCAHFSADISLIIAFCEQFTKNLSDLAALYRVTGRFMVFSHKQGEKCNVLFI